MVEIEHVMIWCILLICMYTPKMKGYWKKGDSTVFIISDPGHRLYGPFGYQENIVDAETMISNMEMPTLKNLNQSTFQTNL